LSGEKIKQRDGGRRLSWRLMWREAVELEIDVQGGREAADVEFDGGGREGGRREDGD
jgi:hypothetical protein